MLNRTFKDSKNRLLRLPIILGLACLLSLTGCASGGNDDDDDPVVSSNTTLRLSFTGLTPLENGLHYEGWAILDGSPLTTGKFNVDAEGNLVDLSGNMIEGGTFSVDTDLSATAKIVLTIEPSGDIDTIPAATKVLAGDVSDSKASLTVSDGAALGDDFTGATGSYILATPTDDPAENETSGIWFLDPSAGPGPALNLPTLPEGWKYEGWAVINGTPVTTGTFTNVSGTDDAAPYSGTEPGPPFPGEDFVMNAPEGLTFPTDLSGGTAVISIEPDPDDSPAPFVLKPLVGEIPSDAGAATLYSIDNAASDFPTGMATIE